LHSGSDARCSELECCEERRALFAAKDLNPDRDLFRDATLSLCSHGSHVAQSIIFGLRILGTARFWPTPRRCKTLPLCVSPCGIRGSPPKFKNHPPPCILIGCCLYQHVGSIRGSNASCTLGASLHPRELSRAFAREGSYSRAEKTPSDSRMRTLGLMPAFPNSSELRADP
jgi:hypothetical protein